MKRTLYYAQNTYILDLMGYNGDTQIRLSNIKNTKQSDLMRK